jgi:hypothetical protein
MLQPLRRLPPLSLLSLLCLLASLGVTTWAWSVLQNHEAVAARRGQDLAPAFILLSLACNWTVAASNGRFRRVLPWLGSWRGQLAAVLGLAALPLGVVVVALLFPLNSALYSLVFLLYILAVLVLGAAYSWALSSRPPRP